MIVQARDSGFNQLSVRVVRGDKVSLETDTELSESDGFDVIADKMDQTDLRPDGPLAGSGI